jgi:4-hydroxybenzoate polyprenyltransferase
MSPAPLSHYVAYMRPRTFPITFVFVVTGYVLAPHEGDASAIAADLAFLFVVYSVLLWGGANAFNSSQDRDEGPVNLLPNPPPIPHGLTAFGLVLHAAAVALALTRGTWSGALTAIGAIGSILYSWRAKWFRRLKEVPGVDNLVNANACGILPVALGASARGGQAPSLHVWLVGAAFTVAVFGGVPTSQIFQLRESDTVQTARNWAAWVGPRRVLRLGAVLFIAHIALLFLVAVPSQPTKTVTACWACWATLVLAAAVHSLWWSRTPRVDPYRRMTRQLGMMMASQTIWVVGVATTWVPSLSHG